MKDILFFRLHDQPYHCEIKCHKCCEIIIAKDSVGEVESIYHGCLGMKEEDIIDDFLCSISRKK